MSVERLEGRVSILAALEAGQRAFEAVLMSKTADKWKNADLLDMAKDKGIEVRVVEESELGAQAKSHGGLVALAGPKPFISGERLYGIVEGPKPAFVLLLEGVDDARNLGYVLRTAEAMGVQAVLLRRRAWDFDSTTVSRASSGSYERLPMRICGGLEEIMSLKELRLKLLGCVPGARKAIHAADLRTPLLLAIGGEKRGLSGAVRELCDGLVKIPTAGGPTSLSTTQAAAIALAEAARQRAAS